jgi:hypothetical protein
MPTEAMNYIEALKAQFYGRFSIREKRPGIMQLIAPLYHEDGDIVDIYLEECPNGKIRINDFGMSLMRLSYSFDLDSENKDKIFQKILVENKLQEDHGNIYIETAPESLYPAVLQFAQGVAKVSNLKILKHETIKSLFYDMLERSVHELLSEYRPEKDVLPIPNHDEFVVDYQLTIKEHPIYIFGIKDAAKSRLAALTCMEFRNRKMKFRSFAVHEDLDGLSKRDKKIILNASDKQFVTLQDFQATSVDVFEHEATYLSE